MEWEKRTKSVEDASHSNIDAVLSRVAKRESFGDALA
jgi:hypothetical protein